MVYFAAQFQMITLWKYTMWSTMTWWLCCDFRTYLVLSNGFTDKGMSKLSLQLAIVIPNQCIFMMLGMVQVKPLSQKMYVIDKFTWVLMCNLPFLRWWVIFSLSQIHMGPVKVMKYNQVLDSMISADDKGIIEYWNPSTLKFPEDEYVLHNYLFGVYIYLHISIVRLYIKTI